MAGPRLADIPRPINPLEQQKLQATISAQAHVAGLERDLQEAQHRLLNSDSFIERMFELVAKCEHAIACQRCRSLLTGVHTCAQLSTTPKFH